MQSSLFFLLLLTTGTIFSRPALAAFGQEGNGGDRRALEFVGIANTVANILAKEPIQGVDANRLRDEISNTRVDVTDDPLSLGGVSKDAINYPAEKRILFNRTAWDRKADYLAKAAFVLHEYLGIMRIEDSSYQLSGRILHGLWFISGDDGETFIDVLAENKFVVDEAVHGVSRMAEADEVTCTRTADVFVVGYDCSIKGMGYGGKSKLVRLKGRKAREVWTLLSAFQLPNCGSEQCVFRVTNVTCLGESSRMVKPAICSSAKE